MDKETFGRIQGMLERYKESIDGVGFAAPENEIMKAMPETEEEMLQVLEKLLYCNMELNRICDSSNTSMYVSDGEGKTLRINKAFEPMVNIKREDIFGRNVKDMESEGILRPSVCALALKEKRTVAVIQEVGNFGGLAVTGVPVFDSQGNLFRAVSNALRLDYIESMTKYFKEDRVSGKNNVNQGVVAESEAMRSVIRLADLVKNTDSSILITGETGVGKGVLARYIHETGKRKDKLMVHINCGAIPYALLESELFGYESGAFTGAGRKGKQGLIEASDGGTLFLDEISELPLLLQVKILDFIQRKKITRVGGTKEIEVDARIIAATNRDLGEEVRRGTFRSDLFYRLNVIPILIPPLRERRVDIFPMSEFFLQRYMKKYNKSMEIPEEIWQKILADSWPGNIRELENYIERVVVTNDPAGRARLEEKPDRDQRSGKGSGDAESMEELKSAMEDLERRLVLTALQKEKSSYRVAKVLGISQSSAYRKIQKYSEEMGEK